MKNIYVEITASCNKAIEHFEKAIEILSKNKLTSSDLSINNTSSN